MEKLEVILSMAGTMLGLTITALTFILKFIKNAKAKRIAEQLTEIGNELVNYIEQAENFVHYSGAEKKEYVLTKANRFAIEKGFGFNAAEIGLKVEELVALTKQVNARDKDKSKLVQNTVTGLQSASG